MNPLLAPTVFWEKGHGAGGKTIRLRNPGTAGKVYTEIVPDVSKKPLQTVIWGQFKHYSDGWRGYNGLVDMGYQKHLRVHQ